MQTYRLAIIGFGNVGQGFTQILRDEGAELAQRVGARFQIVAVCDLLKGSVHNPKGLDPAALLDAVAATGTLDRLAAPDRLCAAPRSASLPTVPIRRARVLL